MSRQWLLLLPDAGPLRHFLPEEACLITTEHLLGNKFLSLYIFLKFCQEIISSYAVRTGSLPTPHYTMNVSSFLKLIEPPLNSLKQMGASFQGHLSVGRPAVYSLFHVSLLLECCPRLTAFSLSKLTTIFLPLQLLVIVVF